MLGSARPAGYRTGKIYPGKIKMMNFTVLKPPNNVWANMWGSQYNAARNRQWMETSKLHGFNCVRVFTGNTPWDGELNGAQGAVGTVWPSVDVFRVRAAQFAKDCREVGLLLCVTCSGSSFCPWGPDGTRYAEILPRILAYAQVWKDVANDIIVYFDAINEVNFDPPLTWRSNASETFPGTPNARARSDLFQFMSDLRQVTRHTPLTVSMTLGTGGVGANSPWLQLQYDLGCDLHDIHTYWRGAEYLSPQKFAAFEASQKYIGRYIISEFGTNQADLGNTPQTFNGAADLALVSKGCMGLGLWCVTDQDDAGGNAWGFAAGIEGLPSQVRAIKAQHVKSWPNVA